MIATSRWKDSSRGSRASLSWTTSRGSINRLHSRRSPNDSRRSPWLSSGGQNNAVQFEWSKTEAIPFSRIPKTRPEAQEQDMDLVSALDQRQKVRWKRETTRWLGVYLDHSLTFAAHRHKVVSKDKSAEGRLVSLINKFGIPPASARNIQVAVVQSTLWYGAELRCDGYPRLT